MLKEDAAARLMELEQTVSEEFREALKIAGYLLLQGFRDDLSRSSNFVRSLWPRPRTRI